jgi:hypothetical protein
MPSSQVSLIDIEGWPKATFNGALEGCNDGSAKRGADWVWVGADDIGGWVNATINAASDGDWEGSDDGRDNGD